MRKPSRPTPSPDHSGGLTPPLRDLQAYTPEQAANLLKVRESWLRRKAAARLIPCTFVGKHLRFTAADLAAIVAVGAAPATGRKRHRRAPSPQRGADLPAPPHPSVHAHRDDPNPDGSH